jgi:dTDP-glucose 4,6-dehydratase
MSSTVCCVLSVRELLLGASVTTPITTLVTGGAGFIGSNFVRHLLAKDPTRRVVVLDALTYAGHRATLADVWEDPRFAFVRGDITDVSTVREVFEAGPFGDGVEEVVHFAAESHVDRSIDGPSVFVHTNVIGTQVLLDAARDRAVRRFVQIGTDEVYGHLSDDDPAFTEETPVDPRSPYSASKAAADQLALAYHRTYGLPVIVTRCSNNYGPYQFPEKLIPVMILKAYRGEKLPVYGSGLNVRDWIHVDDHCAAVLAVLQRATAGRVYNIGGNSERPNLWIVRRILEILGRPESLIEYVTDRPGHDWRYAIDNTRIRTDLEWSPTRRLDDGLAETVEWYLDAGFEWTRAVRA